MAMGPGDRKKQKGSSNKASSVVARQPAAKQDTSQSSRTSIPSGVPPTGIPRFTGVQKQGEASTTHVKNLYGLGTPPSRIPVRTALNVPKSQVPTKGVSEQTVRRDHTRNIAPIRLKSDKSIISSSKIQRYMPQQENVEQRPLRERAEARKAIVRKADKRSNLLAKEGSRFARKVPVDKKTGKIIRDTWHPGVITNRVSFKFPKELEKERKRKQENRVLPVQSVSEMTNQDLARMPIYQKRFLVHKGDLAKEIAKKEAARRMKLNDQTKSKAENVLHVFEEGERTVRGLAKAILDIHKIDPFKRAHPRLIQVIESELGKQNIKENPNALMVCISKFARAEFKKIPQRIRENGDIPTLRGSDKKREYVNEFCQMLRDERYKDVRQDVVVSPSSLPRKRH